MPTLSRQEAAAEMVDGAIGAWLAGKHACAITLAGAAEGGMPKIEDYRPAFEVAVATVMKFGRCNRKEAIAVVNTGRDWLKHYGADKPDQISTEFTWAYVLRAYLHFMTVYPDAHQTENMGALRSKIDEGLEPVRALGKALTKSLRRFGETVRGMQLGPITTLAEGAEASGANACGGKHAQLDDKGEHKNQ
ncbi:hypothetical protein [Methylobacterium sp. B1]|uniref:hypothetical protein n=1 Tax=Methylobacterium sp. B1 TaxID=91459 RepID=UPI0011D26A24|nr:hypothetical protein [Methylobacterium sp. B1]